jgi:very-short-patch-repair endonuclease
LIRRLRRLPKSRTRDIALDLAGYRVIRFTDEQVLHEAEYVATVLARYLRG